MTKKNYQDSAIFDAFFLRYTVCVCLWAGLGSDTVCCINAMSNKLNEEVRVYSKIYFILGNLYAKKKKKRRNKM